MIAWKEFDVDPWEVEQVEKFLMDFPVKLRSMAEGLGVKIHVSKLFTGMSGQIRKESNDGYVIRVNQFEARERQRFMIAHELAHYLLHRNLIDGLRGGIKHDALYRSAAPRKCDRNAHRLATEILMPMELVKKEYAHLKGKNFGEHELIKTMARDFAVTDTAMEIRLAEIEP
ncbi:MAG: ImmA/IrrE family metallo-endopeptidase [Gammaproteobacteria bacterium AqS3]|nr:ImmA/IrrE family metallo-endopeptidase [Gammaproteobacteria bacterium AqS3]